MLGSGGEDKGKGKGGHDVDYYFHVDHIDGEEVDYYAHADKVIDNNEGGSGDDSEE